MKENINTLNEINKGAVMGIVAIDYLINKVKSKKLKKLLNEQKSDYDAVSNKIKELYSSYTNGKPQEPNSLEKIMSWYGIEFRVLTDESDSKITDLILQGINMGIIEGRKILNNKTMDKEIKKLVNAFVKIQEDYVEKLKAYL